MSNSLFPSKENNIIMWSGYNILQDIKNMSKMAARWVSTYSIYFHKNSCGMSIKTVQLIYHRDDERFHSDIGAFFCECTVFDEYGIYYMF